MMGVLHVTSTKKPPLRLRVRICSPWLAETGFTYGSAIRAVPHTHGFTLTLYSKGDVLSGGKIIRVNQDRGKPGITLNLANNFATTGLLAGDYLAASFEYGRIIAQKLPDTDKYCLTGDRSGNVFMQLSGSWLSEIGLLPGAISTVAVTPEGIHINLCDDLEGSYGTLVKSARSSGHQLVQARRNQQITILDIPEYILHRAGFGAGDIIGIEHKYGLIRLFRPDLNALRRLSPAA